MKTLSLALVALMGLNSRVVWAGNTLDDIDRHDHHRDEHDHRMLPHVDQHDRMTAGSFGGRGTGCHDCGCFTCDKSSVRDFGDGTMEVTVRHCKEGGSISWMCCVQSTDQYNYPKSCEVYRTLINTGGAAHCTEQKCESIPENKGLTVVIPSGSKSFTINTHDGKTAGDANMDLKCGGSPNKATQGQSCSDTYSAHCLIEFDLEVDCGVISLFAAFNHKVGDDTTTTTTTTTTSTTTTTTTEAPPETTVAPPETTTTVAPPQTTVAPPDTSTTESPPETTEYLPEYTEGLSPPPPSCDTSLSFTCPDGTVVYMTLPDCEYADCPTPDSDFETTDKAFTKGDPHFKTFGDEIYDFHGECDLVLLKNPIYKGIGMEVHVRTKITDWWSSVETAAIKLGNDVLEFTGSFDNHDQWMFINGEPKAITAEMKVNKWYRTRVDAFLVRYRRQGELGREAHIYLDGPKERLTLKTLKNFVRVDIDWRANPSQYKGALGLLGSMDLNGDRVGRDGKTHIGNHNAFGQAWQVQPHEPKLFRSYEGAIVPPNKCKLPDMSPAMQQSRARRLAESTITPEQIEAACGHLRSEDERKACEYDVIATQDLDMASAW